MKQTTYQFREFYIRESMMEALNAYIESGQPTGSFLQAVISNNLREACGRADDENLRNLPAFVAFLYNEAPSDCWGTRQKMLAWMDKKYEAMQAAQAAPISIEEEIDRR